eukprot:CAMPEP_0184092980 /NCGR_PEP_ID=MMETSP0974-20121125/8522_1 /TAXON_ID=483370 /ORGANISM="non described non described, Strain CCMP2097" /LENGTH=104 /DNA_ID=CAMNT_0026395745 /DNA_START=612 /DNA_END=927 /DNA_ORIENTATION=-
MRQDPCDKVPMTRPLSQEPRDKNPVQGPRDKFPFDEVPMTTCRKDLSRRRPLWQGPCGDVPDTAPLRKAVVTGESALVIPPRDEVPHRGDSGPSLRSLEFPRLP